MLRPLLLASCCTLLALGGSCDDDTSRSTQAQVAPETTTSNQQSLLDSLDVSDTIDTSASSTEPNDPTTAIFLGLQTSKPITWLWQPPKRSMRKANYLIPGRNGGEPAELIVTHFPEAPGNTPDANIRRWTSQFRSSDGGPAPADTTTMVVGTMPVTLMEIHGEYMGMGGAWHKADQRMLVSMVQAPAGSVFIKMLGPDDTVLANKDAYMEFIQGLKPIR